MELALRDQQIHQLKAELEHRKKILCNKRVLLKKTVKDNIFLKDVANDYEKYNNYVINEKEKQIEYFKILNNYIQGITLDLNFTDNKLKESKEDQDNILKEISYLKDEIENLVDSSEVGY